MNFISGILRNIFTLLKDIIFVIIDFLQSFFLVIYDKFLNISIFEKIILLNAITAFFAILFPVARFYIFNSYFYINNPLAVYLICIIIIMFISINFSRFVKLTLRLFLNGFYLFWVIYLPLAGEITKADPYEIYTGYYINMAVPSVYLIASLFSYFYSYE